jgi:O-antigen ligase
VVVLTLYQSTPEFRRQVDMTIFPTEEYGLQETSTVAGVDQGARLETWTNEAGKLDNAPLFGSGIWHRGGPTGLWTTGSHNFWLQMFLETGFIGGILVIAIVVKMWKQATGLRVHGRRADIPLKAALIAVIVGGLGETYFYGGIVLFTALAVYAPAGGLPLAQVERAARAIGERMRPTTPGALAGAAD